MPELAKDTRKRTQMRTRNAGIRAAKLRPAAVPFGTAKSAFKIKRAFWARLGIYPVSGRSLRSARRFGNELRASAAGRLRPADLFEVACTV